MIDFAPTPNWRSDTSAIFPLPLIWYLNSNCKSSRSQSKNIRCICLNLIISTWVGEKIILLLYSHGHRKMVSSYFILLWKSFFGFQLYKKARQSRPLDTLLNDLPFIVDLAESFLWCNCFRINVCCFCVPVCNLHPPVRVCLHSLKPLPFILANSPLGWTHLWNSSLGWFMQLFFINRAIETKTNRIAI